MQNIVTKKNDSLDIQDSASLSLKKEQYSAYRLTGLSILIATGLIGLSLYLNISSQNHKNLAIAKNEAQAYLNKDLAMRLWATDHGPSVPEWVRQFLVIN
ncbi:MAG: hypothetical protein JEZ07_20150 [Phycisphaerae bacterium]|nr:hypothetical protein [Phycisphaerae bacterium]